MTALKKTYSLLAAGVALGAAAVVANPAQATLGMEMHCQGTTNCGMGGAGIGMAQGPISAALNPALGAKMGNEAEIAMGWFWSNVKGNVLGRNDIAALGNTRAANEAGWQESGADNFPTGSMAVNYRIDDKMTANLAIYPGGGGATDWKYSRTAAAINGGALDSTDQQIDYMSLHVAPSIAYKVDNNIAIGVGGIFSYSRLETDSLDNGFKRAFHGPDDAYETFLGGGLRIGMTWDPNEDLTVGVTYRSKVWHEAMVNYSNTFHGAIDQPSMFGIGGSYKASAATTVALDAKMTNWAGVNAIGMQPYANGGFGWNDVPTIAVGVQHKVNDAWTVRAGYTYGESPIDEEHVFANFLFPAITEHHINAGASYALSKDLEFGGSVYWAPKNSMKDLGQGDTFSQAGKGTEISHEQYGFQVSVKKSF